MTDNQKKISDWLKNPNNSFAKSAEKKEVSFSSGTKSAPTQPQQQSQIVYKPYVPKKTAGGNWVWVLNKGGNK